MTPVPRIEDPAITPGAVLQVTGLCFAYPQRALFTDWSARITPGLTLVRGGDGSGKSTLLRLLAGALPAQAGQLQLNSASLHEQPGAYRQQLFWADPRSCALDPVTPVDYFKSLHSSYPGLNETLWGELSHALALTPHLDKPLYMLSTGSKRKVWLAAAFASGAALTLLTSPLPHSTRPPSAWCWNCCKTRHATRPARGCWPTTRRPSMCHWRKSLSWQTETG